MNTVDLVAIVAAVVRSAPTPPGGPFRGYDPVGMAAPDAVTVAVEIVAWAHITGRAEDVHRRVKELLRTDTRAMHAVAERAAGPVE